MGWPATLSLASELPVSDQINEEHLTVIKNKAVSAMIWSVVGQIGSTGLSMIFILVFARFMSPSDFGVFATGTLAISLSSHLAGLGLGTALVQRRTLDARTLSTAFWMSLSASVVLACVLVTLSGPIALLFKDPRISDVIAPLAFAMIIGSATTNLTVILRRDLNMKSLANRAIVANLLSGAVATPFALNGFGALALVMQSVVNAIILLILTVLLTGWPIRMQFDRAIAKDMLRFGIPVMKSDFLSLFNIESPKFFIGLLLGTDALGLYSMASRLLNMLLMLLGSTLSSVMFPLLSEVHRTTPDRVSGVHLRLFKLAGAVYAPVFLLCAVLSVELIAIAFGPQWSAAASVTALLCIAGIPLGLGYVNGATAMAIGHPQLRYQFTLFGALIGILLLAAATPFGLVWVGAALLLRSVITEVFMTRGVLKFLGRAFPNDLLVLKVTGMAGIILVVLASLTRMVLAETSALTIISIASAVALAGYAVCIWFLDRDVFEEIWSIIRYRSVR